MVWPCKIYKKHVYNIYKIQKTETEVLIIEQQIYQKPHILE